jgi:hypothetical protein
MHGRWWMLKELRPNELSDVVCRLSEEQPTPLYMTARPYTNAPYTCIDINLERDKNKKDMVTPLSS